MKISSLFIRGIIYLIILMINLVPKTTFMYYFAHNCRYISMYIHEYIPTRYIYIITYIGSMCAHLSKVSMLTQGKSF